MTDGYTQLGFIGAEEIPGVVRYVTGFLQGAEYAAEQQGLTVDLRTWFAGTYSASDDTTNRMLDWCNNGTTLLFVNGGNLIASAIDAAKETTSGNEVRVMASDYDQNDSSDLILGSAIKCYNSAVQQEPDCGRPKRKGGLHHRRRGPGRPPLALCRAEPARL